MQIGIDTIKQSIAWVIFNFKKVLVSISQHFKKVKLCSIMLTPPKAMHTLAIIPLIE